MARHATADENASDGTRTAEAARVLTPSNGKAAAGGRVQVAALMQHLRGTPPR